MRVIQKYFPEISSEQKSKLGQLQPIYEFWNQKVNLISRKDISHLYEHHVLHSLAAAKIIRFLPYSKILDAGTGGGFPGIPLAIIFPHVEFYLIDAVLKKIEIIQKIKEQLELKNVTAYHERLEKHKGVYDYILGRAVAPFPKFLAWVKPKIAPEHKHPMNNGILYYTGAGDQAQIAEKYQSNTTAYPLSSFFSEPYYKSKYIIHYAFP